MTVNHYENFPVASVLCPPHFRPAIQAIYRFARTADDLADEGVAGPEQRLADLAAYRRDLDAIVGGAAPSARWPEVFLPLADLLSSMQLPPSLMHDLLSAFEQDVVKNEYADRTELLDYCRRSANPIGRLLLHLYGIGDAQASAQSDAICTALQLANFWQDLSIDTQRGRLYLPQSDQARHGVSAATLLARQDTAEARTLIADVVHWARALMFQGAPLVHTVPGRAGWELRLVVQGGLRILEKIERAGFTTLCTRPRLHAYDVLLLAWRSLSMRGTSASALGKAA